MRTKLLTALLLTFLIATPALAKRFYINETLLKDSDGTVISSYSLTSGSAINSAAINVSKNVGFMTLLITENKAGGSGDVDISVSWSIDGTNFYTSYSTDLAGTISADGTISEALGNVTRWIVIPARLAKFCRFTFDPDANSQITASIIIQEER